MSGDLLPKLIFAFLQFLLCVLTVPMGWKIYDSEEYIDRRKRMKLTGLGAQIMGLAYIIGGVIIGVSGLGGLILNLAPYGLLPGLFIIAIGAVLGYNVGTVRGLFRTFCESR